MGRTLGGFVSLRAILALLLALSPSTTAPAASVETLPLGDPDRALHLISGKVGQFVDLRRPVSAPGAAVVELPALVADLATADVVLIGEHHAQRAGHEVEARVLAALADSGTPVALGMEFFESADDDALARFAAGKLPVDEMLLETGWYEQGGINFGYYRPLLEIARDHGAPILGLNVPRSVVRTVSRQGVEALSEADRKLVGDLAKPDLRHRYLVDALLGGFAASMPDMFENMYRGQRAWDAAMAASIVRAKQGVAKDRVLVVIVGVGHVAHGHGIPERLAALAPTLEIRILGPVVAEKPDPEAQAHPGVSSDESAAVSRGHADVAYVLPDSSGAEEYPRFGMGLEQAEGSKVVKIASVEAGGVGSRAGLRAGDVLVAVDGDKVVDLGRLKLRLAQSRWEQRVLLTVRRGDDETVVPVLMVPAPDGPGRWVSSEPMSSILDSFDPRSMRSYLPEKGPSVAVPQARLVSFQDKPVRLDLWDGTRLIQTWKLDDAGRLVKGLFVDPASDGAVTVELTRDASGAVTAERRLGADGQPVASESP